MQETEIKNNLNHNELTINAYNVEIEKNVNCARVGAYMSRMTQDLSWMLR